MIWSTAGPGPENASTHHWGCPAFLFVTETSSNTGATFETIDLTRSPLLYFRLESPYCKNLLRPSRSFLLRLLLPAFKPWVGSQCGAAPALAAPRTMESSGAARGDGALFHRGTCQRPEVGWHLGPDPGSYASGKFLQPRERQLQPMG